MSAIHRVLLQSKLFQYEQKLLEQGADDLDQLRYVSDNDFQGLLEAIGMASKPFHIMRFRNAIGRISASNNTHSLSVSSIPTQSTTSTLLSTLPGAETGIHPSSLLSIHPGAETRNQASTHNRAETRTRASTFLSTDPGIKERTDSRIFLSTRPVVETRTHASTAILNHPRVETATHTNALLSIQPVIDTRTHASSFLSTQPLSPLYPPPLGKTTSPSAHTVTVFATQYTEPSVGSTFANGEPMTHTMMEGLATRPEFLVSSVADADSEDMSSSSAPNVQKDHGTETNSSFANIFPEQLQQLVDSTTPVQLELGPSPIIPNIWDESRKRIIREGSQIFKISLEVGSKRHQSELAQHESLINDASYTLCLWDPTLLVRREELFTLAKKLVKLSSTSGATHEPYLFTLDGVKKSTQPYPLQRGPDGKFQNCFRLNYELREQQIAQLEQLLAENVAEEQVKQILLSDAKRRKDFSMILQLQESISVLGQSYKDLRYQLSQMKKKQRRGVKFQERKKAQQSTPQPSVTSFQSSPLLPQQSTPQPSVTSFQSSPLLPQQSTPQPSVTSFQSSPLLQQSTPQPSVTSFQSSPLLPQLETTTSMVTPPLSTDDSSVPVEHTMTIMVAPSQPFDSSGTPIKQRPQEAATVTLEEMETANTDEQPKTASAYLHTHATQSHSSL